MIWLWDYFTCCQFFKQKGHQLESTYLSALRKTRMLKLPIKVHIFWEDHKILRNLHLTVHTVKSRVEILQNFVAFSECMNFTQDGTLITLLRVPYLGRIGSTKLVLPKWHKHGTLNRVIRVGRWFKKVTKHPDVIYKWTLI